MSMPDQTMYRMLAAAKRRSGQLRRRRRIVIGSCAAVALTVVIAVPLALRGPSRRTVIITNPGPTTTAPTPTTTSATTVAPTPTSPPTSTTAAAPVQVLTPTSTLISQLASIWGPLNRVLPAHISDTPANDYEAFVPATSTYWASVSFLPDSSATATEQIHFMDTASDAFFRRVVGGPWKLVDAGLDPGNCQLPVPTAVVFAWDAQGFSLCHG